jgi:hypothetical protein
MTDDERLQKVLERNRKGYLKYTQWLDRVLFNSCIRPSEIQESKDGSNQKPTE